VFQWTATLLAICKQKKIGAEKDVVKSGFRGVLGMLKLPLQKFLTIGSW